jgi:hypothetical protein
MCPAKEGLPPSLLSDLMGQIRCDVIVVGLRRRAAGTWSTQFLPDGGEAVVADRIRCTGSTTGTPAVQLPRPHPRPAQRREIADFYSARQCFHW